MIDPTNARPAGDPEPHFKKKVSPHPIQRAVAEGVPVRPLSPLRKIGIPLGVAAALALAGGGVAYAISSHADPTHSSSSGQRPRASHVGGSTLSFGGMVNAVKEFISPEPEPPRLAGDVAEPAHPPTTTTPPTTAPPTTPQNTSQPATNPQIPPNSITVSNPPNPVSPSTANQPTHPVPPSNTITPTPFPPKLGGKPVMVKPNDTSI